MHKVCVRVRALAFARASTLRVHVPVRGADGRDGMGVHARPDLGAMRALVAAATGRHRAGNVAESAGDENHFVRRRHRVVDPSATGEQE